MGSISFTPTGHKCAACGGVLRDTLLAKVSYGAVLVKQSKPGELDRDGEEVLMAAFSTAKQALGEGHEVTGKAAAELAIAFKQGGRDAQAKKLTDLARKVNVLVQLGPRLRRRHRPRRHRGSSRSRAWARRNTRRCCTR